MPVKQIVSAVSDIESAIPRDRWDRPLIIPKDPKAPIAAYRRASTVAEVMADHYGLERWRLRMAAEGLAARPDLVQAIHVAETKLEKGRIVDEAIEHAGGSVASRNGSTLHALTHRLDMGEDVPDSLPANIKAMLKLYRKVLLSRFEVVDSERFVVQDSIQVAGTYDRRLRDKQDGKLYIGDLKTGQSLEHLTMSTPAQVAIYASGKHYDLDGNRESHGADVNRGLLIWLPWTDDPSQAICELRWLDLKVGRQIIREAFRVEEFRKLKVNQTMPRVGQ